MKIIRISSLLVSVLALGLTHIAGAQVSLASALTAIPSKSTASSPVVASVTVPAQPPASAQDALQTMFAGADVVFEGEVTAVRHNEGFVEVTFRVDDAVRGIAAASAYTLREWNGLWLDHARYTVGERKLMLLHAASAAGFASPVGGTDGAIPMVGNSVAGTVDLRWVAVRATRQPATSAVTANRNAADGVTTQVAAATMQHADRAVVMDLLHAWQKKVVTAE